MATTRLFVIIGQGIEGRVPGSSVQFLTHGSEELNFNHRANTLHLVPPGSGGIDPVGSIKSLNSNAAMMWTKVDDPAETIALPFVRDISGVVKSASPGDPTTIQLTASANIGADYVGVPPLIFGAGTNAFNPTWQVGDKLMLNVSGVSGTPDINTGSNPVLATVANSAATELTVDIDTSANSGGYSGGQITINAFIPYLNTGDGSLVGTGGNANASVEGFPSTTYGPEVVLFDRALDDYLNEPLSRGGVRGTNNGDAVCVVKIFTNAPLSGGWQAVPVPQDPASRDNVTIPSWLKGVGALYAEWQDTIRAAVDYIRRAPAAGYSTPADIQFEGMWVMPGHPEMYGQSRGTNPGQEVKAVSSIASSGARTRFTVGTDIAAYNGSIDNYVRCTVTGVSGSSPDLNGVYYQAHLVDARTVEVLVDTSSGAPGAGGTLTLGDSVHYMAGDIQQFVNDFRADTVALLGNGQVANTVPVSLAVPNPGLGGLAKPFNRVTVVDQIQTQIRRAADGLMSTQRVEFADIWPALPSGQSAGATYFHWDASQVIDVGNRMYDAMRRARGSQAPGNGVPVYVLLGQSNASGVVSNGYLVSENDDRYIGQYPNAFIWVHSSGAFERYQAYVDGVAPSNANTNPRFYENGSNFGPEATLLQELRERHPQGVYLFKLGVPGSGLASIPTVFGISGVSEGNPTTITLGSSGYARDNTSSTFQAVISGGVRARPACWGHADLHAGERYVFLDSDRDHWHAIVRGRYGQHIAASVEP